MLSFIDWLRECTIITKSENEDKCLNKIASDKAFPQSVCLWIMLDYLDKSYSKEEIDIFVSVYHKNYIKYISSAVNPLAVNPL